MKKIFYSLISGLAFAVLLSSCNKFNDQFEGLDEMTKPTNVASLSYTLTAADYAALKTAALAKASTPEQIAAANAIGSSLALNATFSAANYAPALLNKMYYSFDIGSNVLVTYDFDNGKPTYLNDLTTVNILQNADYQLAWGGGNYVSAFTPSVSASAKLPGVLAAKFPIATIGQYKFVEYNYSNTDAVTQITEVTYFTEDWTAHTVATSYPYTVIGENGWLSKDLIGTQNWFNRVYSSNNYAQASAYSNPAPTTKNEIWMTSPEIDLGSSIAPKFTFEIKIGYWNANCLSVWISKDFNGDEANIATATWVNISSSFTFPETPTSGYSPAFINAGSADLTNYAGEKVRIAFKYDGDGRSSADRGTDPLKTTTYQIDNIKMSEEKVALSVPSTEKQYVAYTFNGSVWIPAASSFIALQLADYAAIGLDYISSTNAPNYLPQLLSQKFPFAQEGNVKTVVYKSSSTPTYSGAMQLTFTDGKWTPNTFRIEKTEQFIFSNVGWLFDPTIMITMVAADHQLMVNYILNHSNPAKSVFAHPFYKNEEYYYGFSSRYSNVNFRISYRTPYFTGDYIQPITIDPEFHNLATVAEKVALMWTRLEEGMGIFLQLRFPNAVPLVSGIEVNYHATVLVYYASGDAFGSENHKYIFKCTAAASGSTPPQFEFVSEKKVD